MSSLRDRHSEILKHAVTNVLSTPIAEVTYGQIMDGLPLADVACDTYHHNACPGHPLLDEHLELSADVLDRARQLRDSFDIGTLKFDSRVYRSALS